MRACDSEVLCFMPSVFQQEPESAELQASDRTPDLEGRLEPGKEEPVQAPHPGYTQTATYNRQIWSSAPQHSSGTRPYLLQLTLPMGAYFWLKHCQVSLDDPPHAPPLPLTPQTTRSGRQTQDVVVKTFLHETQAPNTQFPCTLT